MYHLYHSEAFVLQTSVFGEANHYCQLLTREFGLVRATAQSVAVVHSKLRPGLLQFAHSYITLVRGRNSWKITSAIPQDNVFEELRSHKEMAQIFARLFRLLKRLVQGEEKNEPLFDHLVSAYTYARNHGCQGFQAVNFEYILMLRILHSLGYVGSAPDIAWCIVSPLWNDEVLRNMDALRGQALVEINKSLQATQL